MNTAKVMSLPKCDICGCEALYDAPTAMGWANVCEDCAREYDANLAIGSKFKVLIPIKEKERLVIGIEDTSLERLEAITFGVEDREIECPECGDFHTVEQDARYTYSCEGCGVQVKVPASPLF